MVHPTKYPNLAYSVAKSCLGGWQPSAEYQRVRHGRTSRRRSLASVRQTTSARWPGGNAEYPRHARDIVGRHARLARQ